MAHPRFKKKVNHNVLPEYLNYGYIPGPQSIFKNTEKIRPAHVVVLNTATKTKEEYNYWNLADHYKMPKYHGSYDEAKADLKQLLKSAYNYRMVSDVPVGVFLSGGYDSTSVAAILASEQKEKLNTFTIGFYEGNNEAPQAQQIASLLETNHTEWYCTNQDAKEVIPKLAEIYDEPFADSSAIPTILVSRMARKKVTVALSADGGDEQFFGYGHYFTQSKNLKKIQKPVFKFLGNSAVKSYAAGILRFLPIAIHRKYQIETAIEASGISSTEKRAQYLLYKSQRKPLNYLSKFLLASTPKDASPKMGFDTAAFRNVEDVFSFMDYSQYLPDDILTKVDRATMSVSLEGREPLLDHRIAEFAARLPAEYKYEGGNSGKRILKDIVNDYVPKEIMDQPKRGFTIPVLKWLKSDLKWLLDEYLSTEALEETKTFNVNFVRQELKAFLNGKMHYEPLMWYILMYQMWYFKWMKD